MALEDFISQLCHSHQRKGARMCKSHFRNVGIQIALDNSVDSGESIFSWWMEVPPHLGEKKGQKLSEIFLLLRKFFYSAKP